MTRTYSVNIPQLNGDLYFSVDTYYPWIIDYGKCSTTYPIAKITLHKNDPAASYFKGKQYYDAFSIPIMLTESDYAAGDTIYMKVRYDWNGSPVNDYTLKVHSKMDLEIVDENGKSNMYHMDG